jgi:hypothetical protein
MLLDVALVAQTCPMNRVDLVVSVDAQHFSRAAKFTGLGQQEA